MKFGIFTHVPWPEGSDPKQVFEDTAEEVVRAEELGYHSAWLAEHHFSRYGIGSSLPALAGSLIARTETIRLGTAVLVPPLHNPITLAEDTATLDVISDGRLDVGFGRGTAGYEYTGYNVDREESQERFQESIAVIKGLWTTPEFSHHGKFYQVTKANLTPPPAQRPHPPIYLAATRTLETLEYAATTGHPLMIGVVLDTDDSVALCNQYVHLSEEAGHNVPIGDIPFFRYVYVAETEEQAKKEAQPGLSWTMDMIQWRRHFTESSEVHQSLDEWCNNRDELPTSCEYLYENRAVVGSPEQCVAQIKVLQEQGIEYFGCNLSFGGLEHRLRMKSLELFAKEVMPHFA